MYRCGDFSDSESDIEEHNRCFNFNAQNLFKRKHSVNDATEKEGKICEPTVSPSKKFKNWFRKNSVPTDINQSQNGDGFDPTYGFAKQLENRTYFRNNNVDTSIPMDCMGGDQYQDVLYPLRTSTGSTDNTNSNLYKTGNGRPMEQKKSPISIHSANPNTNLFMSVTPVTPVPRKRVQFDERSNKVNVFRRNPQYHNQPRTKGYFFSTEPLNEKLTLRQRITNFFSNLF